MWPVVALIVVGVIVAVVLLFKRIGQSPGFDKFVNDVTEPVITPPTPDERIKNISAEEKSLQKDQKTADKEAETAQKKSAKIGDYLAKKTIVKSEDSGKENTDKNADEVKNSTESQ